MRWPSALIFAATYGALASVSVMAADVSFHVVDAKGQPIADAVVSLVRLDGPTPPAASASPAPMPEIVQKDQEFSPFVTVIRKGTSIRLPNRDTVEHYVYSESPAKRFQLPLYAPKSAETIQFDQAGIVALGCNIHDWMLAYVVVVDTPWFERTPATGTGVLHDVPAGHYRAEVWHPRLRKTATRDLVVPSADAPPTLLEFPLTLGADHRIRRHPVGSHGEYR